MAASRILPRSISARALRPGLVALAVVALVGCGGSAKDKAAAGPGDAPAVVLASPEDARSLIGEGGVTLLDVRTPEEFAAGHIAGAQNIDFYASDFADRLGALDRGTTYVVYCKSGNRSGQATALMAREQFTSVTDIDGGIQAWVGGGVADGDRRLIPVAGSECGTAAVNQ